MYDQTYGILNAISILADRYGWVVGEESFSTIVERVKKKFEIKGEGLTQEVVDLFVNRFCDCGDNIEHAGCQWPRDKARKGLTYSMVNTVPHPISV